MRALASIKSEFLGVLRNRKLLIAVIGVMLIPLLYSGTFLWAFWDPYGHVDQMPVAVVNQDKGAVLNGKQQNLGNDLVKNLKKKKSFNYQFVSEAQANNGLKRQDYYIKIEIPEDFSQNATTLESDHPKKLDLIYTPNQGFNYLSSKIGDSAITKIQDELSSTVTETYAQSMFQNLKDVANGIKRAGNGAGDLSSGIDKVKSGAADLQTGIHSAQSGASDLSKGSEDVNTGAKQLQQNLAVLASKSVSFSQGVNSASVGSKQVETGAQQLSDGLHSAAAKMPELQKGSSQLAGGLVTLSSSMDKWKQGAASTKAGADRVSGGLQQSVDMVGHMADSTIDPVQKAKLEALKANLEQLSVGSSQVAGGAAALLDNADKLKQASDQLAAGGGKLNQGQNQLAAGINQLSAGAGQLGEGSSSLAAGLDQLASGSLQMKDGTAKLANGSAQLATGTERLAGGSNVLKGGIANLSGGSAQLTNGIGKLAGGSKDLASQLNNGAKEAGDVKANKKVYDMFAKPVNLKEDQMNPVPDYGTGFTPYFLSLSLFVGALMLSVIFPMLEPAGEPKNGFSWFAGKLGILLAVGIGQALLADIVLLKGLGLVVKSVPYFLMLSIFTSWTFLAIIQFLVTVLDNPGRFLGIILLILQLTSSAGTYPIELVPKILQKLNHFLPMSYTIAGFRAIISTGDFRFLWQNMACIAVFFIAFLCATLTYFVMKFKRQNRLQYQ